VAAVLLGGKGGGNGEDVVDDDVRIELLEKRHQRDRGVTTTGRPGGRWREHLILVRANEAEAGATDSFFPLWPGLDQNLVTGCLQRPPEADCGKDVSGVAESGDQAAQGLLRFVRDGRSGRSTCRQSRDRRPGGS